MPMNLKQLAASLGLSQTTVSRALNGYPEVSEKTRERIVAAAKAHNYSPSTRAKSLATGRAMAIGHVIPISTKSEIVNPVFADFIAGAGETYAASNYDMILSIVPDADELQSYRDFVARGTVDGVIVHAPRTDDPRVALLKSLGLPFVVHGRMPIEDQDYPWLDINNRRSFARATDFLLDLGHRRIALINGVESMDFAQRRRAGFLDALAARELSADPTLMVSDEMTETIGYDSACAMLDGPNPPTAFLASSMITAIGIRRAIGERGLTMGRDISVITHDDELSYLRNGGSVPLFTATRSSVRAAGQRAARLLMDRISAPEEQPEQVIWEAELTVGQSTGPAPQSSQSS